MNKNMIQKVAGVVFGMAAVSLFTGGSVSEANVNQVKFYKEAFPNTKPNCLFCHIDKIPKKDDGLHELNAYGLKAKEVGSAPTVETYKEVGTVEEFEAKAADKTKESGADKSDCAQGDESCADEKASE